VPSVRKEKFTQIAMRERERRNLLSQIAAEGDGLFRKFELLRELLQLHVVLSVLAVQFIVAAYRYVRTYTDSTVRRTTHRRRRGRGSRGMKRRQIQRP
jgi:hypothetical protein